MRSLHVDSKVHQDLKPANVLMFKAKKGIFAKLADFGLTCSAAAEPSSSTNSLSHVEAVVGGTLGFMSPEQLMVWAGCRTDQTPQTPQTPCDMWAFGLILATLFVEDGSVEDYARAMSEARYEIKHSVDSARVTAEGLAEHGMPRMAARMIEFARGAAQETADGQRAAWEELLSILEGCLVEQPGERLSADAAKASLAKAYKALTNRNHNLDLPDLPDRFTTTDLFSAYPSPRERAARFALVVLEEPLRAVDLLEEELDVLLKRVLGKPQKARAKKAGKGRKKKAKDSPVAARLEGPTLEGLAATARASHVLREYPTWLGDRSASDEAEAAVLPLVLDLAVAMGHAAEADAAYERAAEAAGLVRQLQDAWRRSADKACCSRRFGSTGDDEPPFVTVCERGLAALVRCTLGAVPRDGSADGGSGAGRGGGHVEGAAQGGGDVEGLRLLAEARPDTGATPCFTAAQYGHAEVVRALVDAGADVDKVRTDIGATPGYIAAQNGYAEVVKVLIEAGADVNTAMTDTSEATPLIVASYLGRPEVVQLLVIANADRSPRSPPLEGRTAAEWCEKGVRAAHWAFFDGRINEEGRAECRALLGAKCGAAEAITTSHGPAAHAEEKGGEGDGAVDK